CARIPLWSYAMDYW
nr:immunoglobulin heavy chain junction region [Mus musculus]MBK4187260.1 immunoglobulin heavy chain junction region [Mus musculus]MBK4187261.1 immunoglobulin heavy chain junction region [Mus musculus]